jgi:hypothetical protein
MRVTARLKPFGSHKGNHELQVVVEAETPGELRDCEAWCQPHRRHDRAVRLEDWVEPNASWISVGHEASPLMHDRAIAVMLLFDRPFCFSGIDAEEFRYRYRLQLEQSPLVDQLVERLGKADHIDMVTVTIEQLLLESQAQLLATTSRRRSQSCMAAEN